MTDFSWGGSVDSHLSLVSDEAPVVGSGESSAAPVSAQRAARDEARSNLRYALSALGSRSGLTDEQKAQYLVMAQTHVETALNAIKSAQGALTG